MSTEDTTPDEPQALIEARARVEALREEARTLAEKPDITADEDARLGVILDAELGEAEAEARAQAEAHAKQVERAAKLAEIRAAAEKPELRASGVDTFNIKRDVDPFDADPRSMTRQERRDNAMRIMEAEKGLPARALEHVEKITNGVVHTDDGREMRDGDKIAERILVTSRPAYRTAFQKALYGREAEWSDVERRAMSEARTSMSLSDTAGGYGVPAPIDPTIILTSGAANAPILSVARVETITNDVWRGVSSAGISWSFDSGADGDAGGVEVSDDAPTLAQPTVTAHTARGFIPFSFEIEGDYPNYAGEMRSLIQQGYLDLLAARTATGSGTGPQGIFTAIAQHGQGTEVTCATNGEINAVDVRAVWAALPERFRGNARWFMNVSVENQIRAAGNGNNGADFTVNQTAEGITLLNGKPVLLSDYAPDFSTTTSAQTNHLVLGDFSQGFLIAQRAGMSVELVPHLFATNANRPNGERGWLAWTRIGFDSIVDNAFRVLINASV